MSDRFVILFVCTGNTCRSAMAEGALRTLLEKERPGRFEVISAGTSAATGFPATAYAIEASKIWNANISSHESQPLTEELVTKADLIFGMTSAHVEEILRRTDDAAGKTFLLKNFPDSLIEGDGVDDPIGMPLDQYNQTFIEIGECLGQHLDAIVELIDEKINASQ
ncbi:MAG: low molecular weight protein arginine phosphatase [Candidatus Zixiibacteriota bacterium]